MQAALRVNQIDAEEYPSTTAIHERCVRQLADLFRVPPGAPPCGFSTIGSSEAIQISLLAAKRRWRNARQAAGLPTDKPNLVVPSTVHVCHEKSCVYFDVEMRVVPVRRQPHGGMAYDMDEFMSKVDTNTILVVAVLGSTYTGHLDDVGALDAAVGAWNEARPPNTPPLGIHVDGASGGFVAPFAFPDFAFDFTACPNVHSINASGHKFGQALAGIGWCLFRSPDMLPKELCFIDKYLGAEQVTATFNFSKSASQLLGQAFMFLRLGRTGFQQVIGDCLRVSDALADGIEKLGFQVISARAPTPRVPLVAFTLPPSAKAKGYDCFDVADRLRERGWVVPAYPLAPGAEDTTVLRVVCRSDFSIALARSLLADLKAALDKMEKNASEERDVAFAAARATTAWRSAAAKAIAQVTREAAEASTAGGRRRSLERLDTKLRHGGVC